MRAIIDPNVDSRNSVWALGSAALIFSKIGLPVMSFFLSIGAILVATSAAEKGLVEGLPPNGSDFDIEVANGEAAGLAAPAAAKGLGLGLDAPATGLGPGAVGGLAKGLAAGAAGLLAAAKGLAAGAAGLSLGLVGVFAKGVAAVVGPVLDL